MKQTFWVAIAMVAAGSVQAGERLSNEEMKSYYSDQTLSVIHFKLGPGKSYFSADGRVRSVSDKGKERVGKWWIDEDTNKRCVRWDNGNKDFCHYTERNADGTYTLVHGKNGKKIVEMKSTEPGNTL